MVDLVLKKLDEDRDGRVNEQDFAAAVAKEVLLLEAFGQCLPNPKVSNAPNLDSNYLGCFVVSTTSS